MIDEHQQDLAALYVFGLLSGDELERFEAELSRNGELRSFAESLQNAGLNLALIPSAAEPSAELRARVLARAAQISPLSKPAAGVILFRFPAWTGWAAAAGFAILAGYTGMRWMNTEGELVAQKTQVATSALEARDLRQRIEADQIVNSRQIADLQKAGSLAELKIAKLTSLSGNSPAAVAIAVWNPLKQEGLLSVQDLPAINEDQSYQLWVVDSKHKAPVSGGVFSVDEHGHAEIDFHPDERADAATHFAISRERKGGVPVRQGPIVALGAL